MAVCIQNKLVASRDTPIPHVGSRVKWSDTVISRYDDVRYNGSVHHMPTETLEYVTWKSWDRDKYTKWL